MRRISVFTVVALLLGASAPRAQVIGNGNQGNSPRGQEQRGDPMKILHHAISRSVTVRNEVGSDPVVSEAFSRGVSVRNEVGSNPTLVEAHSRAVSVYQVDGTALVVDRNGNGLEDAVDIATGVSLDCNGNAIPDEVDVAGGLHDANGNGVPDDCEADCNGNGVPDASDIVYGLSVDADRNGIPDDCQTAIVDAGGGSAGRGLQPRLSVRGLARPGEDIVLDVSGALGNGAVVLTIARRPTAPPAFGAAAVPGSDVITLVAGTDAWGAGSVTWRVPPGVPADETFTVQAWSPEPRWGRGYSASNVLVITTP